MNLLGNKADNLKKKSANVLSIFTKTIVNLETLNEEIAVEVTARFEAERVLLEAAKAERASAVDLNDQFASNAKVATKIKEFLTD